MSYVAEYVNIQPQIHLKIKPLEITLDQLLQNFKELVIDFNKLFIESENYKTQLTTLQSKICTDCKSLKQIIVTKENFIQNLASKLITWNTTKDFTILNEVFSSLCRDTISMTPPEESGEPIKKENESLESEPQDNGNKVDKSSDVPADECMSEILGAPARSKSPIIQNSKSLRSIPYSCGEKKKCPTDWPNPEKKTKLNKTPTKSTGKGKLRQTRLKLATLKTTNVVDLTCSPELVRNSEKKENGNTLVKIKKDSIEIEDTIMPSPTSVPAEFMGLYKGKISNSFKLKKSPSLIKCENDMSFNNEKVPIKDEIEVAEESFNILKQNHRFNLHKSPPAKVKATDDDVTDCEDYVDAKVCPTKRPLAENVNFSNIPQDGECSESLLKPIIPTTKSKTPEKNEPVFKEPTVRKKSEKRALPGWSCDECRLFYDELYKNDPEMLAKKMNECSRHRGRNNPIRPKTPPGIWDPRWDVPDDTEQFNIRNNAA